MGIQNTEVRIQNSVKKAHISAVFGIIDNISIGVCT